MACAISACTYALVGLALSRAGFELLEPYRAYPHRAPAAGVVPRCPPPSPAGEPTCCCARHGEPFPIAFPWGEEPAGTFPLSGGPGEEHLGGSVGFCGSLDAVLVPGQK